jgi:hypothetical protein
VDEFEGADVLVDDEGGIVVGAVVVGVAVVVVESAVVGVVVVVPVGSDDVEVGRCTASKHPGPHPDG